MHAQLIWIVTAIVLLVGLPLVAAHRWLRKREEEEHAPAWWHAHSSMGAKAAAVHSGKANGAADGKTSGKLVGGSQPPPAKQLNACSQCGAAEPSKRCTGCRCAAYCSKQCQQSHWVAGHKHECKKLRKQQQQAAKLGVPAAVAAENVGSADDKAHAASSCEGGTSGSGGKKPRESNSTPPVPKQVLYPAERYAELARAPPQRKQPLGLQNVGNSCYANSLLQSLLATPSLAAYLASGQHSQGCIKPSPSDWCVLCELEKLAVTAYGGSSGSKVLNPRPLLRNVKRLGKQFSFGRQEDSHELFLRVMEAIEAVQLLEAGGKGRYDLRSRETTLIHHVFAGYTRNQVQCLSCGHVSRTYECCTSLALEVGARVASLEAALKRFAAVERLDGDNRYKCDGCKSYVAADKSTRVEAAPHCLQICLKRFLPGRFGKITSKLTFPEQLDLSPYMAEGCLDRDAPQYSLYAVVVHIDWGRSTDYGHYIAFVKSGGSWFQCDDDRVTPVAAARALAAGAYLLFYERKAPRRMAAAATAAPLAGDAAVVQQMPQQEEAAEEAGSGGAQQAVAERVHAQREQEQQQGQQGGMLRVETAPGSLPHLYIPAVVAQCGAGAAGSTALSAASSGEQLLLEYGEQQEGIEVGLPERLHASASESDLVPARQRSAAAAAQQAQQAHAALSMLTVADTLAAAHDDGGSPASHRQEQQAAAAAAQAEVAHLQREQQEQEQGTAGPADADSDASSDDSEQSRFEPTPNPFNLLGPASSEDESGSEAARSERGGSGGEGPTEEEQEPLLHQQPSGSSTSTSRVSSRGELAAAEEQQQEAEPRPQQQAAAQTPRNDGQATSDVSDGLQAVNGEKAQQQQQQTAEPGSEAQEGHASGAAQARKGQQAVGPATQEEQQ